MRSRKLCYTLGALNTYHSDNQSSMASNQQSEHKTKMIAHQVDDKVRPLNYKPKTSQQVVHNQLNQRIPKKLKLIQKMPKDNQRIMEKNKKMKNFRIDANFTRKIFSSQNFLEIQQSAFRNIEMIKVYDWLMEACSHLNLSKNAYYSAIVIADKILTNQKNLSLNHHSVQILSAAMISLSGKFQSNTMNYPEVISHVCTLSKEQIIQGQIFIMSSLKFHFPFISINEKIIEIFNNWFKFVSKNQQSLQLCRQTLTIGQNLVPGSWKKSAQKRYINITHIFDIIMMKMNKLFHANDDKSILQCLTLSMFIWFNYQCNQFFPVNIEDQTYLASLLRVFLKKVYSYENSDFMIWMRILIRIKNQLNIIQNVYKNIGGDLNTLKQQMLDNYQQSESTIDTMTQQTNKFDSDNFYCQKYNSIWKWNT